MAEGTAPEQLDEELRAGPSTPTARIVLALRVRCESSPDGPGWPTRGSRIVIGVVGYAAPAVFTFGDLFDLNVRADLRQACRSVRQRSHD